MWRCAGVNRRAARALLRARAPAGAQGCQGLVVPIQGFEVGQSPSLQSFILRSADVPGRATVLAGAFWGVFADSAAS